MKKQSALQSWSMLMLALPKGILTFVIVVTGICVSLPLIIIWVGLPLLALTLAVSQRMMSNEEAQVEAWLGNGGEDQPHPDHSAALRWNGWSALISTLGQARTHRAIIYSLAQLPIGIACFTIAVVVPVTAFAVMLTPLAYRLSTELPLSFDLYSYDPVLSFLFTDLDASERAWAAGGIGLVLVLLVPKFLKVMGRLYSAWVQSIASHT
ncbi:hypothetical protein GCM10010912_39370 [Paenibacillus albidus]|uniref:Putative sensor domain-containing protein n=1 Tax=Paenibacillus albidus TaxID=2041023 RepID=A0A917CKA9_9BACL|nr:sensor domain-containing protein [Paenibacillus albidus]GGF90327.1 hypothetical protein GCM10010912_39370 [Paenibacillus albidus]